MINIQSSFFFRLTKGSMKCAAVMQSKKGVMNHSKSVKLVLNRDQYASR